MQKRVLEKEHEALPEAIKLISEGKVKLQGRKVFIKTY
ncbi:phosphoribosylglycinamide formyltransferase [Clostridium botulinum CFSAN001628]|nr:phosphoribosylglycinamide formyltransferase [Clostridium botulinum CFSAN001628]